jgi:hypothetical protein
VQHFQGQRERRRRVHLQRLRDQAAASNVLLPAVFMHRGFDLQDRATFEVALVRGSRAFRQERLFHCLEVVEEELRKELLRCLPEILACIPTLERLQECTLTGALQRLAETRTLLASARTLLSEDRLRVACLRQRLARHAAVLSLLRDLDQLTQLRGLAEMRIHQRDGVAAMRALMQAHRLLGGSLRGVHSARWLALRLPELHMAAERLLHNSLVRVVLDVRLCSSPLLGQLGLSRWMDAGERPHTLSEQAHLRAHLDPLLSLLLDRRLLTKSLLIVEEASFALLPHLLGVVARRHHVALSAHGQLDPCALPTDDLHAYRELLQEVFVRFLLVLRRTAQLHEALRGLCEARAHRVQALLLRHTDHMRRFVEQVECCAT